MTEPLTDSNSDAWLDLLRRMLPAGAPLPDEEQLDYSIAVEYKGPPLDFPVPVVDPLASSQSTLTKLPKFRKVPSVYSKFAMHVKENSSGSGSGSSCSASRLRMNSSSESESKIPTDQSISEFNNSGNAPAVDTDENAENEYENDNDDKYDSVDRNEYNLARPIDVDDKSLPEGEKNGKNDRLGVKIRAHACSRCGKNNRLREREFCIVCGARYCRNCLLKAMGSMPEGRKCVGCIGEPIDEANREKLGKCSRLLAKICSPLEVKLIMKAESECLANQIQPEQVWVNGRPLREEELVELLGCAIPPQKLRPEKYWYDKDSGLWGKEGEKPDRIISSKLNVGGKLQIDASKGNTKVFINGREITKVELRVLKLAKVQCQRGTHFWVYDDGSYEEEGQNNIRGNIWGKASTRFICSLFSLPVPPGNIHGPKEDATAFSGRSIPEYLEHGRLQTLLLFGLEGSGTSTIFKQVKFISKSKFTVEEVQNIKLTIQRNIYRYLSVLLEGREHFEEEVLMDKKTSDLEMENFSPVDAGTDGSRRCIYSVNQRVKHFSDWLLEIIAMGDLDTFFPAATREYAPVVDEIWKDPAIQETYKRRDELHFLPDTAKYFLDQAIEISSNEYEPSEKDILFAEGVTPSNGLASLEFSFDDHSPMSEIYDEDLQSEPPWTKYQLIRISSKGDHDSGKWLEMFEDVKVVIFCVALSDYDLAWTQGDGTSENKMLASRDVFESLVRHTSFEEASFVLLLNKYDIFENKINQVPLTVCDWFHDFRPLRQRQNNQALANQAYYYVAVKFKQLYASITGKKLFVWPTRALQSTSVDEAFRYVREVLMWDEEKEKVYCIAEDDSFSSTETDFTP
ncbi:extra-large guanine nucleotide-binding protein 3-like isoform X2 [Nicotiana tomentosiformis]|uniref:extra-large guanine nucleotide-binding protein 3-like isoform X2 n=1 Tax=Nicotiana tomentosiformis TaxID=4098 RepID=UPI00051C70AB|nr:extra-large guanine nucleotide-binding protein 3-like [Nicotiana tomentosiformis]